jgi:Ca2+-binding RTX toxin-like protein
VPEFAPAWSPDGTQIAFTSNVDGNWEIYVVDADGGAPPTNVSRSPNNEDLNPDWSPDGKEIVFQSCQFGTVGFALKIVVVQDRKPRRLPKTAQDEGRPAWNPADREKIAYVAELKDNYTIYTTDPAGKLRRRIVDLGRSDESDPGWAPDGRAIVFASNKGGNYDVYTMALDGSSRDRTNTPKSNEIHPAWQPRATSGSAAHDRIPSTFKEANRTPQVALGCLSGTITGTTGNDSLCGSSSTDTIQGLAGDDKMWGYGNNDTLKGDLNLDGTQGRDWLWGGEGNDTLWARDNKGDCTVNGGGGAGDSAQIDSGKDPVSYIEAYF